MATNTNIKLTADVKAFRQAFGEAAGTVKSFTSEFDRRASDVQRIGGRIAEASKNLNLSTDSRKFARGIENTFAELNRELNVATGREQLFGSSLDTTRGKLNAYQGALNSLLASGMKPASEEARRLTSEIQRLNAEAAKFKPVKSTPNTLGNLGSVVAGQIGGGTLGAIGGAFGPAGAAIGVTADKLISLTSSISRVTDEYAGYRIVLENVTGSQRAAANSFDFAAKRALEAGFQIGTVENAYKGFVGAGKTAGLSLTQLNSIFQGTTRYGATFKLSNDQIGGSLLALSQMLSKSVVSAEELRGQLGERMPGSFSLFAKAMGMSEQKLGKMLEQGKILAKDALPKFAAELEKAAGTNFAKNLQTASGSMNNLRNNMNLLMDAIGRSSEVNTFFASFNNGLSNVTANLTALVKSGEWSAFFMALTGSQAAMNTGAVTRTMQSRTGFSQMSEQGRNSKIYEQIALVARLETNLNALSQTYAKTGQKEAQYFKAQTDVEKAKAFLDQLVKIDAELTKADRPSKSKAGAKEFDPKAAEKLTKSLVDASNQRIADGLIGVQNNALQRQMDAIGKTSDVFKIAPNLTIVPADTKLDKNLMQYQINKALGDGVKVKVNVTPEFSTLAQRLESNRQVLESFFRDMGGMWQQYATEFSDIAGNALGNALGAGFSKMGAAIATGENPFKAFGEGLLQSFGDMLLQVGQKMLAEAGSLLALSIITGGAASPFAYRTLALGGALTVAGGAMRAVKLADGGIMDRPTYAMMGEYSNARLDNEVAAPISKLTNIMRKALLPDIKAATYTGRASQPIYITTINTTDGRETSRSTKRYDTRKGYVVP